jgi:hypothetical protein
MANTPAWNNGDQTIVAARRWRAVTLQNRGLTHMMIAQEMLEEYRETTGNTGMTIFQAQSHVSVDITRALKEYRQRSDQAVEERITAQSLRFAEIRRRLYAIIASRHPVLYQGAVVYGPEGPDGVAQPLQDHGPVLTALAQLQQLEDRQARLEGTYQREKLDIALERRVHDEAADVVEAILAGAAAVPELDAALRQRMLEAAGAHLRTIQGEVVHSTEGPDQ